MLDPSYGAVMGFYKGLRKEWPQAQVRVVDFAPEELHKQPAEIFKLLVEELEHQSADFEVAYLQKKRYTLKIVDCALEKNNPVSFAPGETFLVTGGARGITAAILKSLAKRYPVNFIVVGSTVLPDNIATLSSLTGPELDQLKPMSGLVPSGREKSFAPIRVHSAA